MDIYLNRDLDKKVHIKFMEGYNGSYLFYIFYGTCIFPTLNILLIYMEGTIKGYNLYIVDVFNFFLFVYTFFWYFIQIDFLTKKNKYLIYGRK